jgi:hypothetical protein
MPFLVRADQRHPFRKRQGAEDPMWKLHGRRIHAREARTQGDQGFLKFPE